MVTILDKILKWMLKANLEYKYNTVMMKIMCLFWLEHKLNFRSIQSCQICFDCCGSKLSYQLAGPGAMYSFQYKMPLQRGMQKAVSTGHRSAIHSVCVKKPPQCGMQKAVPTRPPRSDTQCLCRKATAVRYVESSTNQATMAQSIVFQQNQSLQCGMQRAVLKGHHGTVCTVSVPPKQYQTGDAWYVLFQYHQNSTKQVMRATEKADCFIVSIHQGRVLDQYSKVSKVIP